MNSDPKLLRHPILFSFNKIISFQAWCYFNFICNIKDWIDKNNTIYPKLNISSLNFHSGEIIIYGKLIGSFLNLVFSGVIARKLPQPKLIFANKIFI